MLSKDDLWEWFCSFNEAEQLAVMMWLVYRDAELLLSFQESSDNLQGFCRIAFVDRLGEKFL